MQVKARMTDPRQECPKCYAPAEVNTVVFDTREKRVRCSKECGEYRISHVAFHDVFGT